MLQSSGSAPYALWKPSVSLNAAIRTQAQQFPSALLPSRKPFLSRGCGAHCTLNPKSPQAQALLFANPARMNFLVAVVGNMLRVGGTQRPANEGCLGRDLKASTLMRLEKKGFLSTQIPGVQGFCIRTKSCTNSPPLKLQGSTILSPFPDLEPGLLRLLSYPSETPPS